MVDYIERDIERKLLAWMDSDDVLELLGARQVGKTTLLKQFGVHNFTNVLYISFMEDSGRRFKRIISECEAEDVNNLYIEIFNRYAKSVNGVFSNDRNTLVIIDEIQEDKAVYEMIKPFHDHLHCKVAVTGSYLYQAVQYFQPVGCTKQLTLFPISFMEFIAIFQKRKSLEEQFFCDNNGCYDKWYEQAYKVYCKVGGYPAVVMTYLRDTHDINVIQEKQQEILNVVIKELSSRMGGLTDNLLVQEVVHSVVGYMLKEKRGGKLIKQFTKTLIHNTESLSFNQREIKDCIAVLAYAGLISFCDKFNFQTNSKSINERIYFNDLGLLSYCLSVDDYLQSDVDGILAENFVFKTLNEPSSYCKFRVLRPQFGVFNDGELDFTIVSALDNKRYVIEVKSGKNQVNTGNKLLEQGRVDFLVIYKGIMQESVAEQKMVLPIWLSPLFQYDCYKNADNDKRDMLMNLF